MNLIERELARHALGLPNKRRKSYRNHFVTGPGCFGFEAWQGLVARGLAICYDSKGIYSGNYCFVLTEAGAREALNPAERLDDEDFRKAVAS